MIDCQDFLLTDLLQLVDNLHQAGKIHNLQQVCVVSGRVNTQVAESLLQAFVALQSSSRYQDAFTPPV